MCPFGFGCGSRPENDEKEVVREVVVMIPCRYCRTLFPQTVTTVLIAAQKEPAEITPQILLKLCCGAKDLML